MKLCGKCKRYLTNQKGQSTADLDTSAECSVCLGVWSDEFSSQLTKALHDAIGPYGDFSENKFSFQVTPPTIILPADLAYRFHVASKTAEFKTTCSASAAGFGQDLKEYAKKLLAQRLKELEGPDVVNEYPSYVKEEEQGHLAVQIFVTTVDSIPRPLHALPLQTGDKKRRRRDFEGQGGHPVSNLSKSMQDKGIFLWPMNKAFQEKMPEPKESDESTLLSETTIPTKSFNFHVALWRRPFYMKGCYTKTRRDVSQSPMIVVDEGKKRTVGVTSVEEQILPIISRTSGGISTVNNDPTDERVLFGMAKFHASGREDIDVRMLLPDPETLPDNAGHITGRPFVCEIIDALRLPPVQAIGEMVHEINHTSTEDSTAEPRSYGRNPMGVAISSDFNFTPSSSFGSLQAETEHKVKYYGCLCWSEDLLPESDELNARLGTFPLEIQQPTPIRVLHRRPNMIRIRHVLTSKARRIDDHYFHLHISTDAGTYVKEYVRGDLGRTVPSVSTLLGCKTDILKLDCEGIQGGS
jgi:tRNA pseudouridine(54/55) synthase